MATFDREKATVQELYVRMPMASGENKYYKLPFNLVTYDDRQTYVEPVSMTMSSAFTWEDSHSIATQGKIVILDTAPQLGVTEIR